MFERLRQVELFAELSDEDLVHLCQGVDELRLEPGEVLVREGEPGDCAYLITEGEVEVVKATAQREVVLARRAAGAVVGEMALVQEKPRNASVRARTAVALVAIPKAALDAVLDRSPSASRSMLHTLVERMEQNTAQLRHQERMAQLGTLTAGVAHELNNPAAAARRAAQRLAEELDALVPLLLESDLPADTGRQLLDVLPARRTVAALDALARSDAESEAERWLEERGVAEPWNFAAELVEAGVGVADLAGVAEVAGVGLEEALRFVVGVSSLRRLGTEIEVATRRLSEIVGALKSYTYLDQAPVQDVDVVRGIEETLVILGHKLGGIRIERDYADDLPAIAALGGELNQVWTNLIDNACDALAGIDDRTPTIALRARAGEGVVVIEVEDNGPGIPPELQERVFDAFYTTKPPGQGTGLGLHVSRRIVVLEHHGDLTVTSETGRTTFRVTLPAPGAT